MSENDEESRAERIKHQLVESKIPEADVKKFIETITRERGGSC